MPDEMLNLKRSEVTIVRKLKQSEYSTLFQVSVRGRQCVLKVVSEGQAIWSQSLNPQPSADAE